MKKKIIKKKLVIISIILLLSTTPLLVATSVNENIQPSNLAGYGENSLGQLYVEHNPYLKIIVKDYDKPDNNTFFEYWFDEVDGYIVNMNFSLTIEHWKNELVNFSNRFTWINDLWIAFENGTNIFRVEDIHPCNFESHETYYINISSNQLEDVYTGGQDITLIYYLSVMPAWTNSNLIRKIMDWLFPRQDGLKPIGGSPQPLTIHPV